MSTDNFQLMEDEDNVVIDGNSIFFYAQVSNKSVLKLNKALMEVCKKVACDSNPHINLYINSEGGDLYAGLSAMDHVACCRFPVHTIMDGFVASAATLIAMAGKKRFVMQHCHVLLHQLSTSFGGKFQEMMDDYKNSKKLMKLLTHLYESKTRLTEDKLSDILKREKTLDSKAVLKYGLAEGIWKNE